MSSEPVSLDHYRQRADQEHGHKRITVSDGTVVTLRRPLRMTDDERKKMYAARDAVRASLDDHPEVVEARKAYATAVQARERLSDRAHAGTVEKKDAELQAATDKLNEAWELHGEAQDVKEERAIAAQRDFVRAVADSPANAQKLLDDLDGDHYMLQLIIADWDKQAEPGEASPSPS